MSHLIIDEKTYVVVMTGAGVSQESGIPTFRDANGLWEGNKLEDVASPYGFINDPEKVWRFYSLRREAALKCDPNAGHLAIAELERRLGDRFLLVTQNVDDLHERAGSQRVLKIHGNIFKTKCSKHMTCPYASDDTGAYFGQPPTCPLCGANTRPDIVWFGESLDGDVLDRFYAFIANAREVGNKLHYIAAGTSGVVYPAAGFIHDARAAGAETTLVNSEETEQSRYFDTFVQGKTGSMLPMLFDTK